MPRRYLPALAAAILLNGFCGLDAEPPADGVWEPIPELTDEFEGGKLDASKWCDHNPSWKGRQPGYFSRKNVAVKDGKLQLTARAEDLPGLPEGYHTFTTAAVKSKAKALYGYFEVKCKPMDSRASSSFWFYAQDGEKGKPTWWTEIDVFEIGGGSPKHEKTVHMNVHVFVTPREGRKHWSKPKAWTAPFRLAAGYHTYGLDWSKEKLTFYVDGVQRYSLENTHWHQSLHMNFDSETMPQWFGLPRKENLPSTFNIEYVRSWRRVEKRQVPAVPVGVAFHRDTIHRSDNAGDNWCITWCADDSLVTSMCDGNWLGSGKFYHNRLYRIAGGPEGFTRKDIPGYPDFSGGPGSWFGYGIVSAGGVLYSAVSKTPRGGWSGPFRGIKLLKSPDNGTKWYRVDRRGKERFLAPEDPARNEVNAAEMFFLEEFGQPHQKQPAYPFSMIDFVKAGKDNAAAKDGCLYIYGPEGAHAHKLLLARVPAEKLGERGAWEYFVKYDGERPVWSRDIRKRGNVLVFPEKSKDGNYFGWYSWLPSVVWNEGLGLYIMVNGGTYAGHGLTAADEDYYDRWMHNRTGSLGFWYAENPYGPWHEFYYTDYWVADDPKNLTYQPKLSPKWISSDGKNMVLTWSDAMKDGKGRSHTVNYRWNQMKITLLVE